MKYFLLLLTFCGLLFGQAQNAGNVPSSGGGGTSSPFGVAFPATGTAVGASDGVNMQPLLVDGAGLLKVVCSSGCVAGGSFADSAVFTFSTTSIGPTGFVVDNAAPHAVTDGHAAAPRMSANRVPFSTIRDAAGNERGVNVTAGNALVVDGSAATQPVSGSVSVSNFPATQPVSGTVTANQGGAPWSVAGPAASGTAKSGNPVQIGAVFNTTQPTVTTGQVVEAQATARGAHIVATGVDVFNVTVSAALPTGANTIGAVTQASGPWTMNLTQINGTTILTGGTAGSQGVGGLAAAGAAISGNPIPQGLFDGTNVQHNKSASLTNFPTSVTTTARNIVGASLVEKSSRWAVVSAPAVSTKASASIAAEASVRHVVDCISFSQDATTAVASATALTVAVRDGATGAGTIIWEYVVEIPAAAGNPIPPQSLCGLNLVGTTNTAMTLEYSALVTNLFEAVSMSGYNVN